MRAALRASMMRIVLPCLAALCALPGSAHAGSPLGHGKLLLTGGVSGIDGAAGGGLTPWAVTGTYATQGQVGATAHLTRVTTRDYALTAYGATLGLHDRAEVSLARQEFDAGAAVPGALLRQTILGVKLRVLGDAVLDSDTLRPQVAVGVEFKRVDPGAAVGAVLDAVAAGRSGTDAYVSATKLFLAQGVLVNATLRATQANQNGLLGFGSAAHDGYRWLPELSVAKLLGKGVAVGAEYRAKPDNLAFAGAAYKEDAWKDVFLAWAPNKRVSVTFAWVDLGNIVGHDAQRGAYVSLQWAP